MGMTLGNVDFPSGQGGVDLGQLAAGLLAEQFDHLTNKFFAPDLTQVRHRRLNGSQFLVERVRRHASGSPLKVLAVS
jgi:hypothetical protein